MSTVVNKAAPDGDPAFADFHTDLEANTPDFPNASWVVNSPNLAALIGTGTAGVPQVPKIYWIIDPPNSQNLREMTPAEIAAADTDPQNVIDARAFKKLVLEQEAFGYILSRYPEAVYNGLVLLFQQAVGLRSNYIITWFDWTETVYQQLASTENLVDAAVDIPAIDAISMDLSPFDGTDPLVSIQGAMNL